MKHTRITLIVAALFLMPLFASAQEEVDQTENPETEVEHWVDEETDEQRIEEKVKRKHSKGEIKTLARNGHSGGYGAIGFKTGEFAGEHLVMATAKGAWTVNRVMAIGFNVNGIIPTAKYEGIATNNQQAMLLGGFGGMFIEPIVFSNQIVHITFPVEGGAGWLGYEEDWENSTTTSETALIDEDVFWYVEPGAAIEVNVSKTFRINFGVSKRFTQDLELLNTDITDFEDYSYFMTLKFGRF